MIDYQVQLVKFPSGSIKEAVTENEDGSFTIFIAESLPKVEQQKAFLHAMKHIMGDDFSKDDVNAIEQMAHAKGDMYYETDFYKKTGRRTGLLLTDRFHIWCQPGSCGSSAGNCY